MFRFLVSRSLALSAIALASACGGGGGGGGGPAGGPDGDGGVDGNGLEASDPGRLPDPDASRFDVAPAFGTPADGVSTVEIEIRLVNRQGRPIRNALVFVDVTGAGNVIDALPLTDPDGRTHGALASFAGEAKTLTARTGAGGQWTGLEPRTAEFQLIGDETYFVRAGGSDANDGRAPRSAWRTLAHALSSAGPGATVHVGAGVQAGPLSVGVDSRGERPLWIAGDPSGRRTGDAGEVVLEAGGSPFALELRGAHNVVLQGLTLRGAAVGLSIVGSSEVRVLGCAAEVNDVGISVLGADELVLQDCRVDANRLDGVRLAGVRRTRVENNLIYANLRDGLVLATPSEATVVRYNTFYGNAGPHLREAEKGGQGTIEENILADGLGEPVVLPFGTGYLSLNNILWGHSVSRESTPSGFIDANPLLADPDGADDVLGFPGAADDDFRLLPPSIALDLGGRLARDVVLASRESLATRTSRVDGLAEASGADRPATNLGHHVRLAEPEFASVAAAGVRIAHADRGDVRARTREWSAERPLESAAVEGPVLDADVVFLEQRLSPRATREELLAAQVDTGTQGRIVVRHWDGRGWNEPALAPFLDGLPRAEIGDRRFDVEYEQASGRALLVAAGADGVARFQVQERGRWSLPEPVPAAGAGSVRWVELAPRPGSDEIACVTLDDERDLVVTLWDGEAFGEPRRLEANTLFRPTWRPFDAAFESGSGDLLVSWGFSTFAEETRWATLERASGAWRTGQFPSTDAIGAHVELASDPTTDRVAAVMGEGDSDNDVIVAVWDGAAWVHAAELTLAGPLQNRLLDVEWIGDSGVAAVVFRRMGLVGSFNVALFLPTGWRIQRDVQLPGVNKATKVRLASRSDPHQIFGLVLDDVGELHEFRYDGAAFALLNGGRALATGLDVAAPGRAFDLAPSPLRLEQSDAP